MGKDRSPSLLPVLFAASLLAACQEKAPDVDVNVPKKKAGFAQPGPAPLYFTPPVAAAVPDGGKLWVPFRRGHAFPGAPVSELVESFDLLAFRIGGDQWVVEPAKRGSEVGVFVDVGARRGGSLLGFTTDPRPVHLEGPGGVRKVLVQDHCKLCLNVREGVWEPPSPSAAVAARFGFALEFAPVFDPLPIMPGGELPIRLRFGKGLVGVEVVAEQIVQGGGGAPVEVFRGKTGEQGLFFLNVTHAGLWRLRASHEVPASGEQPAVLHRATLVFRTGEK